MDVKVFLIGTVGEDMPWDLPEFLPGILTIYKRTISFRHIYNPKTHERTSYLLQPPEYKVNLFLKHLLNQLKPKAIIINPVYHEFSVKMLEQFLNEDYLIAIDVQGFLRRIDEEKRILLNKLPVDYKRLFENVDIVKTTMEEKSFLEKRYGEIFIVTKGKKGSEVFDGENARISAPIIPLEGDPTGAGDVFLFGFLARYIETRDASESLIWGQALASMVVDQRIAPRLPEKSFGNEIERIKKQRNELKRVLKKRVEKLSKLINVF